LIKRIWPDLQSFREGHDERKFSSLFSYLQDADSQLRRYNQKFAVGTLELTIDLIQTLRAGRSQHLREILPNIEDQAMRRSLELAVRIWLMLNVNSSTIAVGPIVPNELPLDWPIDTSLDTLIEDRFMRIPDGQRTKERMKMEGTFTAAYLVNVCGIRLSWTDHLTDHLRSDPHRQVLTVYKHKICLVNHLKSGDACPIPKDVLNEALDTLNLLFPFGDPATKRLLGKGMQASFYNLGVCGRDRELDLNKYEYWREEIQDLLHSFRRPPRTLKQLAFDRRNMMDWAAFWVTVMVAVLTLVSIPCNIIQVVYAVKGYHVAL
ncbi:hypothetical protein BCR34DRAFT_462062, partial [Clohesyomyces aquaticus]